MKDEYIIINKTAIQKRIEELERLYKGCEKPSIQGTLYYQLNIELKKILSQSTPLIPEIEEAFNTGFYKGYNVGQADAQSHPLALTIANYIHKDRQDYISNLKLDI